MHDRDIKQNSKEIKKLKDTIFKFNDNKDINTIFFAGQIYDAFSKIVDIMSQTKKELIIVDPYADKIVLDMISKLSVKVILIIKEKGNLADLAISKYNEQYNNLEIIRTNSNHDRFFILDRKKVYHCGTSINHAGCKTFAINLIEEDTLIKALLNWLDETITKKNL